MTAIATNAISLMVMALIYGSSLSAGYGERSPRFLRMHAVCQV